jgi:hypothetical protein
MYTSKATGNGAPFYENQGNILKLLRLNIRFQETFIKLISMTNSIQHRIAKFLHLYNEYASGETAF